MRPLPHSARATGILLALLVKAQQILGHVAGRVGVLPPLHHQLGHLREARQEWQRVYGLARLHLDVLQLLALPIDARPARRQWAALHAMGQPGELRVLVEDARGSLLRDGKIEDRVEQLRGMPLHLVELKAWPRQLTASTRWRRARHRGRPRPVRHRRSRVWSGRSGHCWKARRGLMRTRGPPDGGSSAGPSSSTSSRRLRWRGGGLDGWQLLGRDARRVQHSCRPRGLSDEVDHGVQRPQRVEHGSGAEGATPL